MRSIPLAAALAATLAASPAAAQETGRTLVAAQLDRAGAVYAADGFADDSTALGRPTLVGILPRRGSVVLEVALDSAAEYRILAVCGARCSDLDLELRTAGGRLPLVADTAVVPGEPHDVAEISGAPPVSGPYLLRLRMRGCDAGACWFGLRFVRRPVRPAAR